MMSNLPSPTAQRIAKLLDELEFVLLDRLDAAALDDSDTEHLQSACETGAGLRLGSI